MSFSNGGKRLHGFDLRRTCLRGRSRELYAEGLARLDELARAEQGAPFAELSPDHQDALLEHVERLDPRGEHARLRASFEAVLNHTIDGFLADPLYGGNRDFIGWQLIGYPGPVLQALPRTAVDRALDGLNVLGIEAGAHLDRTQFPPDQLATASIGRDGLRGALTTQ